MFGSAKKREVLELIGERAREGKWTSFRILVAELLISPDAACSHLTIRELEFRITRRGLERLERWKELDAQRAWFS